MVLVSVLFPAAAPIFTTKNIAQEFKNQYDGTSPVYIIKFLHPGFTFYTDVYGTEIKYDRKLKSNPELTKIIQESRRAYFVIRQSDYEKLTDTERQILIILAHVDEKVLLLQQ